MMTDVRIQTGNEKRLAPVVGPTYEVGWSSLLVNLDDFAVWHRTVEHGGCDYDSVAHNASIVALPSCPHIEQTAPADQGQTSTSSVSEILKGRGTA
jgi:hypothetical protein